MQSVANSQQQLWDDFLHRWPLTSLKEMRLEEYVSVNDNDTFTYWLETKTRSLGSIQGNTSAKFGIYKRNREGKEQGGIEHGAVYSWRTKYGHDEQSAFQYVRKMLCEVAEAAAGGDLNRIDNIDFSPLIKWKVAFLYQNQQKPCVINTFSKQMLQLLTDPDASSYPEMYRLLEAVRQGQDLLEYGAACWDKAMKKSKDIQRNSIIEQFSHIEKFVSCFPYWSEELVNSFCNILAEASRLKLDIFNTQMATGGMIRIGRKDNDGSDAKEVFGTFEPTKSRIKFEQRYLHRPGYYSDDVSDSLFTHLKSTGDLASFAEGNPISRKPFWPSDYTDNVYGVKPESINEINEPGVTYKKETSVSLNQILYGPPGTGKTYHTVEAAVKAAEPTFGWENRAELKAKYDALVDAKRIRFVTFHQSFGYEDFVEGLVAETTEDKQVAYRIKDGVFKKICDDAAVSEMHADPAIETNGRVWKLSIEGAHQNATKTYCLENDLGAIGWGDTGDLSKDARNEYFKSQGTNNQNSLMYFCHEMAIGDLVLCIDSKSSVEAVGVVTGEYRYAEEGLPTRDDYCHQLPIKWLAKGFSVDFKSLNYNKQFSLPTCYPLSRLSVGDVLSHLQSQHIQVGETPAASVTEQNKNFVLVIDEINRGNISKIFGELITLIEDSKRGGAEEAISLTLPYSNKPFSVPDNLYIIGTMNTADRSLAMMDTALRRRFDFVEMMPNPSLLRGAVVKGIDLELLLQTLNERIEILYDREHTLGHAFLMPVRNLKDEGKEDDAFAKLVSVFQNKVVPLLQEYFFEDWQKIRLVLGDNQREAQLQFIDETTLDDGKLTALFGSANELNHYGDAPKKYQLKPFTDKVWTLEETYIGIYQTNQAKRELE
ncbi:AAA family ATPase [Shewanella algae]|uniref:AAA family ATPase n=1 Tax=Shewanella algae TaxID=38313 RepID=UPI0031F5C3B6